MCPLILPLPMKFFSKTILASLMFLALSSCAQKKLSTKVTYIQPYCGGARPTPEIEAEGQKQRPYSNRTIIIVSGLGKIDSALTDKNGVLKKVLRSGNYKLFEAWRFYKSTPNGGPISHYDQTCLSAEWNKAFRKISITKNKITEEQTDQITFNCEWFLPCILEQHLPPRRE
jgi:hypothetical protein